MMGTQSNRHSLRQKLLHQRSVLPSSLVTQLSQQIVERIQALPAFQAAKTIGAYYAIGNEVDLSQLLHDNSKHFFLPKMDNTGIGMHFVPNSVSKVKNAYGIPEPLSSSQSAYPEVVFLDLVIVPIVGFNHHCDRLGRGGGHYDRFLSDMHSNYGSTLGVAYECQRYEGITALAHDVTLDRIVTDKSTYSSQMDG